MARLAKALKCSINNLVSRKAEYFGGLSQQEQAVLAVYREGRTKYRKLLDLVVEWDAEDGPSVNKEQKDE